MTIFHLDTMLFGVRKIPVDDPILAIPLLQPLVRLLKVSTVHETPMSAQRTRMHRLQHQMLTSIDLRTPFLRRRAPGQEHDASPSLLGHDVNNFLREVLPTFVSMAVRFVRADGEAGVEQQDSSIGPRCEEPAVLGWSVEVRVVFLEGGVHVLQAWWSRRRWTDGEAEAVGLVDVVVGVLA